MIRHKKLSRTSIFVFWILFFCSSVTYAVFTVPVIDPLLKRANSTWLQRAIFIGGGAAIMGGYMLLPSLPPGLWEYTTKNLKESASSWPIFSWFVSKPKEEAPEAHTQEFLSRTSVLPLTHAMLGALAATAILSTHALINLKTASLGSLALVSAFFVVLAGHKHAPFSRTLSGIFGSLFATYFAWRLEQIDVELRDNCQPPAFKAGGFFEYLYCLMSVIYFCSR